MISCALLATACHHPDGLEGLSGSSAATTTGGSEEAGASTSGGTTGDTGTESSEVSDEGTKFDMAPPDPGLPPAPAFPTTCEEAAEGSTSVGCEFYPLAVVQQGWMTGGETGFVVANVAQQTANVTLSDIAGQVAAAAVPPGGLHTFVVDATHQLAATTQLTDDGFVVESDQPLQLWSFSPPPASVTNDAGLVLPRPALGVRHRIVTYNAQVGDFDDVWGEQWFAVVATEDDTEVTFELAQPASLTLAGGGVPALDFDVGDRETTVVLDRLQVLTIAAPNADLETMAYTNELTGSEVRSDKPVAVYAGTPPTYLPVNYPFYCCADLITDAVPPTSVWGRAHAAAKFQPLGNEPDVWRIIGDADGTVVELSGGVVDTIELDAGQFVDVETAESFWAESSDPFGMVHFMVSSALVELPEPGLATDDCGNIATPGDPAFAWHYPVGNWLNRYLFPVGVPGANPWCHEHATLVAPLDRWQEITFGGAALPEPTPLGDGGFGYAYLRASAQSYEVIAPAGVGVQIDVYGYQDDGSFVYPGGVGLQDLNPAG